MPKFKTGIYMILCQPRRKYYVGSAAECEKRWGVHRHHLRKGTHHSIKLQRAWNKYGEKKFLFRVLEECSLDFLAVREQYWMDELHAVTRGYNCHPTARSARGHKVSPAALEKIRSGAIRRAADPQERLLRSERAKAQHAAGKLGRVTWNENSERKFGEKMKLAFQDGRMDAFATARAVSTKSEGFRQKHQSRMRAFALKHPEEMSRRSRLRKDRRPADA